MAYSLEMGGAGEVMAGDEMGRMHMADARVAGGEVAVHRLHPKKSAKINSLHAHPLEPALVLSASSDHTVRLWDVRRLAPAPVAEFPHPRVVNCAFFSPLSGRRIASTGQDNRLRVWDYVVSARQQADREVVHANGFSRFLTPFRAVWDPKDWSERTLACGRNVNKGERPAIDLVDAATGCSLAACEDPGVDTITSLVAPHPRLDLLAASSGQNIYLWEPGDAQQPAGGASVYRPSEDAPKKKTKLA